MILSEEMGEFVLQKALRYCGKRIHQHEDIEEVVSFVCEFVVTYCHNYDPSRGTLEGFLMQLIKYGLMHYFTRKGHQVRRGKVLSLDMGMGVDKDITLGACIPDRETADLTEIRDEIRSLIRCLKVRDRRIIKLRAEGKELADIAALLNESYSTIVQRYRNAMQRMRHSYLQKRSDKRSRRPTHGLENTRLLEAGEKGRLRYVLERQKDRQRLGWVNLKGGEAKVMAYLSKVDKAGTEEIAKHCEMGVSYCRNILASLKRQGYVRRAGGGGVAGQAIYQINKSCPDTN